MTYRALVIEDEEVAGEANAAYLTRLGLQVVGVARSGRDGVRLLKEHPDVDLVLLDMHLPDGHGLSLLRSIRAAGLSADVIAVTSARDLDVVRQAVSQGVVAYLIKPFTFAGFKAKIEQYLAYRHDLDSQAAQLGQADVDAVLAALRPALRSQPLPKGLTAETLHQVSNHLRQSGPLTAGAVATGTDMSRVTARRYLEYLAESGVVERSTSRGGLGRPEVIYAWR